LGCRGDPTQGLTRELYREETYARKLYCAILLRKERKVDRNETQESSAQFKKERIAETESHDYRRSHKPLKRQGGQA